jgi:hypothetical protein
MNRLREWASPIVYLSNNWISFAGVVLVTTATVMWIFLLPTTLGGEMHNPYMGILAFMVLPGIFGMGLLLIPLGIFFRLKRERRLGSFPASFGRLSWENRQLRRLVIFVGLTTFVNVVIASHLSYGAVTYMDSVTFCGQTCHTVMEPEFVAYQHSAHARVECVKCHIGPGASWFVRSKLSGVGQVFAVAFNTHPRPIPTPVENLRPARETCETCHWPQKYGADRLRLVTHFGDDEANTPTRTVLLMRIGGGGLGAGIGIHGVHLGEGVRMRYGHSDDQRQNIPWVEYRTADGEIHEYFGENAKPEDVKGLRIREMDCMDCHTRPSHRFEIPERAVDNAMAMNEISPSLPFARRQSVEILKREYATREEANQQIPAAFEQFYREQHPEVARERSAEISRSAQGVLAIFNRNVFPRMNVTWGTYPDNIGHTDFPGCFRCHDNVHSTAGGDRTISQDCTSCHSLLAMEEAQPPILTELGLK